MVDVSLLRDIVAIAGVFVGLTYYILNIREVRRNRRITLTTTMLQPFMTGEGYIQVMKLMSMEWDSIEDFMNKYDHRVDRDNAARRMALWNTCNSIGSVYRDGLLDLRTIFTSSGGMISNIWYKFEPIINYYRTTDYSAKSYDDFEYLAEQLREYNKTH